VDKIQADQMLVGLLKQELQQAEDIYRGAWETKRDAFLAGKIRDAQAKRAELEKGLAGYAASVALRLHAADRLLSQEGGPVPMEDISDEKDFQQELETNAIHSGKTPQEAETYAKRVTAATKAAYEGYRNRAADGVVRLPGSR
jgi:hypothetical protein